MSFLVWHYREGVKFYLRRWRYWLGWVVHQFSFPLLLKTLFAPWKRMIIKEEVGFNLQKWFEKISFNLISRWIGATVRLVLLGVGVLLWFGILISGAVGFLLWLCFPFLSLIFYWRQQKTAKSIISQLVDKIKANPSSAVQVFFTSFPGQFILSHLGVDLDQVVREVQMKEEALVQLEGKSLGEIASWLVNSSSLSEWLSSHGLRKEDFLWAVRWWEQKNAKDQQSTTNDRYGKPGIGLELLFGYTPNLDQYITDLAIPQPFSHRLIGRQQVVSRIEQVLTSGRSVFLVGQPGVGKKTVVLEFARRASEGELGKQMAYRRVIEFNYNPLLSQTTDLNLKKTKLAKLLKEAIRAGNIILVIRDLHRLTNPEVEGYDFTDVFVRFLEKGLRIIAILSSVEYERFVATDVRLAKYFETVRVVPPTKDEAMLILMMAADNLEKAKKIVITVPVLRAVLEGSDRYITEIPFPEKALELLEETVIWREQRGGGVVTSADVEVVLEQKTGISLSQLNESEKDRLKRLEELIHQRLVDQEAAVSLIAKSLRARSVGAKEGDRPVGSFLFLGPTGVGKTQTAKALAQVYFGNEKNILRFDMAEYADSQGLSRLIGLPTHNRPGVLTTAIKNHPASLLLLDEIEKAPSSVINLFLALLDEGRITDAYGKEINCRHLFVIATSNAGAEYIRQLVSRGVRGEELQVKVIDYVQKKGIFSPEFLNRFDGVVVYEPLKREDLVKIARLLLEDLAKELAKRNVKLEVTLPVCQKLAQEGFNPAFGARPMRRIVELTLGDVLGRAILEGEIKSGDRIEVIPGKAKGEYHWRKLE